jgi:hypothetical protein
MNIITQTRSFIGTHTEIDLTECADYYFSESIFLRLYELNSLCFLINVISLYK